MRTFGVVIPTHNRHAQLFSALDSLAKQTQLPDQVVIVDDGSSVPVDVDEVHRIFGESLNTHIIRNASAHGVAVARNAGAEYLTTDWVCFLDDDDMYAPEKISAISGFLEDNQVDCVIHGARIILVNERLSYTTAPLASRDPANDWQRILAKNFLGGTPMVCFTKAMFEQTGGFDHRLRALEDYELWIQFVRAGARLGFVKEPLSVCHYVTGSESVSKSIENNRAAFEYIDDKYSEPMQSLHNEFRKLQTEWRSSTIAYKMLLNGHRFQASKYLLQKSVQNRSVKLAVLGGLYFLGLRMLTLIRKLIGG